MHAPIRTHPFKFTSTAAIKRLLGAVALLMASACSLSPSDIQPKWALNQNLDAPPGSRLEVVLDRAELSITGTNDNEFAISAQAQEGTQEDLVIDSESGVLRIEQRGERGRARIQVELLVPQNTLIDLQIAQGSVMLEKLAGTINVQSTSAEVVAADINGELWIVTPRARVELADSTGEFHILGQAGAVSLSNLHGSTSATTIMGEIEYRGRPQGDDLVKIESDHAGVLLKLAPETSADLVLESAGGQIICSLPGLNKTGRDCAATVGGGSALIDVRTVSGKIRIERWTLER